MARRTVLGLRPWKSKQQRANATARKIVDESMCRWALVRPVKMSCGSETTVGRRRAEEAITEQTARSNQIDRGIITSIRLDLTRLSKTICWVESDIDIFVPCAVECALLGLSRTKRTRITNTKTNTAHELCLTIHTAHKTFNYLLTYL